MRPSDCKDRQDADALYEQGIAINDWSLDVDPAVVIIKHHYGELRIPMSIFKRFAKWYLRNQEK